MQLAPTKCAAFRCPLLSAGLLSFCPSWGLPLKMAKRIKNLGVLLSSVGVTYHHIHGAIRRAQEKVQNWYAIGVLHRGMSGMQALSLWRTFVQPLWEFGLALTSITRPVVAAVEIFEQSFWAKACGPIRTTSLPALRSLLGLESIFGKTAAIGARAEGEGKNEGLPM